MRYLLLVFMLFQVEYAFAQTNEISEKSNTTVFWDSLKELCGKAYSGEVLEAPENDSFRGKDLVMHVRSCEVGTIKIPFFVGNDKSRTWVLSKKDNRILLKHDHRHEDGSEDEITQYGGLSTNVGLSNLQMFPADPETSDLIPAASTNVWWIEIKEGESFTYNLRRIGTDRYFSIKFDLTNETETPSTPWGWGNN